MKRFISIISASALVFTITFVGASLNSCRRKNPDVQSSSQTQKAPELPMLEEQLQLEHDRYEKLLNLLDEATKGVDETIALKCQCEGGLEEARSNQYLELIPEWKQQLKKVNELMTQRLELATKIRLDVEQSAENIAQLKKQIKEAKGE